MNTLGYYKNELLSELEGICGGAVYLNIKVIPASYPCGAYEFKGYENSKETESRQMIGDLLFSLYLVEDITDYGNQGDIWIKGESSDDLRGSVWEKASSLSMSLKGKRIHTDKIEIYPMDGDGGRDLICGRVDVRCKSRLGV
ncbi:MAG: hypothetical protein K9M99_02810 [Candidatus Cloacimonetes bacterium]|nr:hypothetical protein [Candidatus Cloacimonadota bacterium]